MVGSKSNVKEIHRSRRLKCFKVGFDFSSTEVSFFFICKFHVVQVGGITLWLCCARILVLNVTFGCCFVNY